MFTFDPVPLNNITLSDAVLARMMEINSKSVIPYCIKRCKETGRIDAFKLNWKPGDKNPPHIFWDSDFAKVIEGMCLDLISNPDKKREAELDKYIDLIISAQQPDGYLNTHFTVVEPDKRWDKLWCNHELYCAGHLMEAAVAHFKATGKRKFLDCLCRYADYIGTVFGNGKKQKKGYPGHEEIELALCKLADASGKQKYAELSKFFIDQRGQKPNYFEEEAKRLNIKLPYGLKNLQAHKPVREQDTAVGHAVRALYLYSGMADVAARFDDAELLETCKKLYDSVVHRNMYITGGIGSARFGESFTRDFHLPNADGYAESCGSIALALFLMRMGNITGEMEYYDNLERVIYNGAASGLGLDGQSFFYSNKLEVTLAEKDLQEHIANTRQPWFNCSCCPTNFCRFLAQLPQFAYSCKTNHNTFCVNIPVDANIDLQMKDVHFKATVSGNYPLGNYYRLVVNEKCEKITLRMRVPFWLDNPIASLNGKPLRCQAPGLLILEQPFNEGDTIEVKYALNVHVNYADPRIAADAGKAALSYGPFVLAFESIDNATDDLSTLVITPKDGFRISKVNDLPKGVPVIKGNGYIESHAGPTKLYSTIPPKRKKCTFAAIPYCLWQNRGESNMIVWVRYQ